jgi:hypothetical protein
MLSTGYSLLKPVLQKRRFSNHFRSVLKVRGEAFETSGWFVKKSFALRADGSVMARVRILIGG